MRPCGTDARGRAWPQWAGRYGGRIGLVDVAEFGKERKEKKKEKKSINLSACHAT